MERNWRVEVRNLHESGWREVTPANMTAEEASDYAARCNGDYSIYVTYRAVRG